MNDTASEASDDENYSVAQFQRTINPAFRSSSPQPSTIESHHDPESDLAMRMGKLGGTTPPSRERTLTPQTAANQPTAPPLDYRKGEQMSARMKREAAESISVPHNEYPVEGMTMFCRADQPPSERSSAISQLRPSSRDSHSEYSNPTSLSSMEPVSVQQSPTKSESGPVPPPLSSPDKQDLKKRNGFFSNSPFRRKSKHERDGSQVATPTSRNTWGPNNSHGLDTTNTSPSRRGMRESHSGSPEPADPRANFQLNVGPNVFDVASPDKSRNQSSPRKLASPTKELDPIAAALEELKGVNKQSSVRMSADRYAGVATPAPPSNSGLSAGDGPAAHRPTPPPSYSSDQKIRRLDAPQPAFTSSQMRQTTQKYVGQNQEMYGTGSSRPSTRGNSPEKPRALSPRPMRSTSPRPPYQSTREPGLPRAASPNPYGGAQTRPRQTPNSSPTKPTYSRHTSPGEPGRSPPGQPQYRHPSNRPGSGSGMEIQLAESGRVAVHQGAGGRGASGAGARPTSYYGGGGQQDPQNGRPRSKSMANGRQYTHDGRPILNFGKSSLTISSSLDCPLLFSLPLYHSSRALQDIYRLTSSSSSFIRLSCGYSRRIGIQQGRHASCFETAG